MSERRKPTISAFEHGKWTRGKTYGCKSEGQSEKVNGHLAAVRSLVGFIFDFDRAAGKLGLEQPEELAVSLSDISFCNSLADWRWITFRTNLRLAAMLS